MSHTATHPVGSRKVAAGGREFSVGRLLHRSALACCLALLIGLVVSYVMLVQSGAAGPKKSDFIPYFSAAHLVITGHGAAIYAFHQVGQFESTLVYPLRVKDGVMPYLYPPYFASILAPLALLPYTAAYLLWLASNALLLGWSLLALGRLAKVRSGSVPQFWLAALSFLPIPVGLAQGQTSILLLALFTGALLALRSGRPATAGCVLACALIKPTYVIPIVAVLVMTRRWKAVLAFLATSLALFVAPIFWLGISVNLGYWHTLLQASGWRRQIGGFEAQWNHSIAGFVQLLLPGPGATVVSVALCLLVALAFLRTLHRPPSIEPSCALALLVGLLASPHVLIHDLTLLMIPAAVAWGIRPAKDRLLPWILGLEYCLVLVGLATVTIVPLQLSVLGMAALAVWFLARAAEQQVSLTGEARPVNAVQIPA